MTTLHDANEEAQQLRAILEPLDALTTRITGPYERSSPAWSDRKRKVGRFTGDLARIKAESAGDHLRAWRQILAARKLPLFAHYSLLRTALETSSVVRWLVDPRASQAERIARGVGTQLHDLDERRKFEDAARSGRVPLEPHSPGKPARFRLKQVEELADAANVKPIYRGAVECCRDYGRVAEDPKPTGEIFYRLLSSMAHGTSWSILPMSERRDLVQGDNRETYEALITADALYTVGMTAYVMRIFALAVDELARYGQPR